MAKRDPIRCEKPSEHLRDPRLRKSALDEDAVARRQRRNWGCVQPTAEAKPQAQAELADGTAQIIRFWSGAYAPPAPEKGEKCAIARA
jgi:hypothetical protein